MLLLEAYRERADGEALDLAVRTLEAMARGGVYDQIGGGFHRYATDAAWRLPHFEKMLYDNALLVPVYLEAWKETGRPDLRRVAEETLAWVMREMTDARGGFYASLDADSDGEEGRYYLWTADEIRKAAPPPGGDLAIAYYGLRDLASGVGGRGLPRVPIPLDRFAKEHRLTLEAARSRLEAARGSLLRARALRLPPRHDDKIVTAWNGLMISAFARATTSGIAPRRKGRPASSSKTRGDRTEGCGPHGRPVLRVPTGTWTTRPSWPAACWISPTPRATGSGSKRRRASPERPTASSTGTGAGTSSPRPEGRT